MGNKTRRNFIKTTAGTAGAIGLASTLNFTPKAHASGHEDLYMIAGGWWAYGVWKQLKYGAIMATEFWTKNGSPMRLETVGPMEADMDRIYSALESAIAKNPKGIIYYCALGLNEGKIVKPYLENGGMLWGFGGSKGSDFTETGTIGTNNSYFGELLGKEVISLAGSNAKVGIQTIAAAADHQDRVLGMKKIFKDYPNVKILQEMEEGPDAAQGTANAAAFTAANPNFDIIVSTGSLGGHNAATALEEAGVGPGEKFILCGDITDDILQSIRDGYITKTLAQQFASEGFYGISTMHLRRLNPAPVTGNDPKAGLVPGPVNIITDNFWIDKNNIDLFAKLNQHEGGH